jgi:CHAT domain-containing protein
MILGKVKRVVCILFGLLFQMFWSADYPVIAQSQAQSEYPATKEKIRNQVTELKNLLVEGRLGEAGTVYELLGNVTVYDTGSDTILFAEIKFYCGTYLLLADRYDQAIKQLSDAVRILEHSGTRNQLYRKALSNLGVTMYTKGDYLNSVNVLESLISFIRSEPGSFGPDDITYFNNLASSYNELKEYEKAIIAAAEGIEVASVLGNRVLRSDLIMLNNNIGISYSRRNDYTTALLYLERAWDLAVIDNPINFDAYISVINSLTVAHTRRGDDDSAESIFENAYPVAIGSPNESGFILTSNYASFLAEKGDTAKTRQVVWTEIDRLGKVIPGKGRTYQDIATRFASILARHNIDNDSALELIENLSIKYVYANPDDLYLIKDVFYSYAVSLMRASRFDEALIAIQTALFPAFREDVPKLSDPDPSGFITDRSGLGILKDKVEILRCLYEETSDTIFLSQAIKTNMLLVSSVEKVRIEISEEESRLLLGDNYRSVYDGIIADLHRMFSLTGGEDYFRLTFEYAERSKAAGLLVSLREIKASQFLIPDSLAKAERSLERELGYTREQLSLERSKQHPDNQYIINLRESEFRLTGEKNRLARFFETEYPEYFSAKYNTDVASIDDVLRITGRKGNYLNYIFTDTVMYTFVINRNVRKIISTTTNNNLLDSIRLFRELLQAPVIAGGARSSFARYMSLGNYLYTVLFKPAEEYLISDMVIISPDNILTYLPFEALIRTYDNRDDLLYRELDFLLREYLVSYTYSATMYVETSRQRRFLRNRVVAFAPEYATAVDVRSILNNRQSDSGILRDLPYAREEAAFVASKLGGELYLKGEARESTFKERAPFFSILHLAMHTVIDESSPGYSKLIFSNAPDGKEDGYLNTYEIYTVPLSARMVVVSSCNTGTGRLSSGEGVMSLARGFINAGSQSVVMSLWEVNDEWGTEVVNSFYVNLLNGQSKSKALRRAKLDFFDNADANQFRGNPFYWATLVIYGNNESLFYNINNLLLSVLILLLVAAIIRHLLHRPSKEV